MPRKKKDEKKIIEKDTKEITVKDTDTKSDEDQKKSKADSKEAKTTKEAQTVTQKKSKDKTKKSKTSVKENQKNMIENKKKTADEETETDSVMRNTVSQNVHEISKVREQCLKLFNKAVKLFQDGKQNEAGKKFKEITNTYSEEIDIVNQTRIYMNRMERKLDISVEKDDFHSHLYLGHGYYNRCFYEDAIKAWTKAAIIADEFAEPFYNIAGTQSLLGKKDEALMNLAMAIKRDPKCLEFCLQDQDFDVIRESKEFESLVDEAKAEIANLHSKDPK